MTEETFIEIREDGSVEVAPQGVCVGKIEGLRFIAQKESYQQGEKAFLTLLQKALQIEFEKKIASMLASEEKEFSLGTDGQVYWKEKAVAKLVKGKEILHPEVMLLCHQAVSSVQADQLKAFLKGWLEVDLAKKLSPLFVGLRTLDEENASGQARGVLYQVVQALGVLPRFKVSEFVAGLTEIDKKVLAKAGMRLGRDYLFFQGLLKPAAQQANALLWKLWNDKAQDDKGLAIDGKMSFAIEKGVSRALYLVQGYALAGSRAIRVDVIERLTAKLREVTRQSKEKSHPLPLDLLSLAGLKRDEVSDVFHALGFKVTKEVQQKTQGEETKDVEVLMIRPEFKKHKKPEKETKQIDKDSPFSALAVLQGKKG